MGFLDQIDAFHELASAATGFDDFGPTDYLEPMRRLLSDLDRYPDFSDIGTTITTGNIVGRLAGRLAAQHGITSHPDFAAAPVRAPIIVLGLPRTGTTALHRLMAQDPDSQVLELWLGTMPMPRPPRETWDQHPAYVQVSEQLEQLYAITPELRRTHPMSADAADECRYAIEQDFWATSIAATASVPDYREWCLAAGPRFGYERYRQVLGLIAGGDDRRWILKNPDHIFALDVLLEAFPDACIVHTHRDPEVALASVASMSYDVLRPREPNKTALEHGRDMSFWIRGLENAEHVRRSLDAARFCDLHMDALEADPVGAIEQIYGHFGLGVSDEALAACRARATKDPRAGHGTHRYSAEQFGISTAEIRDLAPSYCERYDELCATFA